MKFSTAIPAFLSITLGFAASVPVVRQTTPTIPNDGNCISVLKYNGFNNGVSSSGCASVTNDCVKQIKSLNTDNIWSINSCVAGATCYGPNNMMDMAKCARKTVNATVPDRPNAANLDYNVYASIVGDCAWQDGGCPITQQNYVDFIFGRISATGNSGYPTYTEAVEKYWGPIVEWANVGDSVPYVNFNDWLHYGPQLPTF